MGIFTATIQAVAVSAAQDVFEIVAPAGSRVLIHDIKLGQFTDFGDAAAEILSVDVIRGYTTSGTGGAAVTPVNVKPWGGAATSTVERNNTTVATAGSPVFLVSDVFNIAAGWSLRDVLNLAVDPAGLFPRHLGLEAAQRLVVRITAPADAVTLQATLMFEEGGV